MSVFLRYAVRSDLGLVRTNNEDSVYAGPRLLAIADGMGGHAAGEVASKIVISTLEHLDEDRRIDDLPTELHDTVVHANHRIAEAVAQRHELEGMGTTLTALRFVGSQIGLVHVGDSRAYLMRDGELTQITRDDTYVQYLVETGKITPEEAKDHPRKSVILRALLGGDVEPSVSIREAVADDRYLLCSDGLSDVVSAETIADTLRVADPQEAADRLVELALRSGGPDNVTVIVADVVNARPGEHVDDVPVIAGAFVDPAAADVPDVAADSPAERAARIGRPPVARPVAGDEPPRRRRRWRGWLIALIVLLLAAGGLASFYAWTQSQYFVGRTDGNVAIFQGVDTAFGPVRFYSVDHEEDDLAVAALCPADQTRVKDGITASDRAGARRIVTDLRRNRRLDCPAPPKPCPDGSSAGPSGSGTSGGGTGSAATTPSTTTAPPTTTSTTSTKSRTGAASARPNPTSAGASGGRAIASGVRAAATKQPRPKKTVITAPAPVPSPPAAPSTTVAPTTGCR